MSYPFVAAKFYTPGGMVEPRAIVIHFAEGAGTVSWLTHPYTIVNGQKVPQDNSSHFIIERVTGRTVQMVKDADASHSLHVARPYGPPGAGDYGIYSLDVAKACLGAGIADPCAYIFAIELEGTAAEGPDGAQTVALVALVRDLRARHPSLRGLNGHRDYQNYKACPGGKVPWAALGGHGLFTTPVTATGGADVLAVVKDITRFKVPRTFTTKVGTTLNGYDPAGIVKSYPIKTASPGTFAAVVSIEQSPNATVTPHGAPFLEAVTGTYAGLYIVASLVAADLTPDAAPAQVVPDVKHTVTVMTSIDSMIVNSFTKAV